MDAAASEGRRPPPTGAKTAAAQGVVFAILLGLSFSHLLNDTVSSLVLALYPIFKRDFHLAFAEVGLITLTFQATASLLQPLIGRYTDHRPKPYSLPLGMSFTLVGLLLLSIASSFTVLLAAAALIGVGSAVFHPESSRVARLASGGRHGLAQSLFQVGGSIGSAIGPLVAALIILRSGRSSIAWFALVPLLAIIVLTRISGWYKRHAPPLRAASPARPMSALAPLSSRQVAFALAVLLALIFSKYFYLASLNSYYTFYLIDKFHLSVATAQLHLFIFLAAVACGTVIGGPLGDRYGRKYVIWGSILGVCPFTLALPYANLFWTGVLTVPIGLILSSAFSAIVVYATELIPGKVGMIAGLFFGLAFGIAGIGAAVLGAVADLTSITFVYRLCAFLPLIGMVAAFLPNLERAVPAR
ncbi:MAG TPA: MFS transporter [Stellaceae bacterium]|nr:MFS transporter [Stellaceae bacterium]